MNMSDHSGHGNTVAAWTGVVIAIIAFFVGTIGVVIAKPSVFWIGIGLLAVAALVGKVLSLMGFGAER